MVDLRAERRETTRAKGTPNGQDGIAITCHFNQELFDQIRAQAAKQGWTFSHMVRHLCEASIEGIE